MKHVFLLLIFVCWSHLSVADGFLCAADAGRLRVSLYNHTSPQVGTRRGAVLILADKKLQPRHQTLAIFRDERRALVSYEQSRYEAYMDLREDAYLYPGGKILGIKIDDIYELILEFDFSFSNPISSGVALDGTMLIIKRNGEKVLEELNCHRYLKGQPIAPSLIGGL